MSMEDDPIYSLEIVARICGVEVDVVARYREEGFIHPMPGSADLFDDEALRTIRRIEHLRVYCGVNTEGLRLILGLLEENERLHGKSRARW